MNIAFIVILALNIIVSYQGFQNMAFFRKYEFHIGSIRAGDQFRMFSSAFLHADVAHLAFNMLTLYFFADAVIIAIGSFSFALVYLGSLIFGSLLTLYFHKNDYSYRAIGASGAVMGIVYSAILLQPNMLIYGFIPGYMYGVAYLLFSIYGMKSKSDNIGHTAHFGGAVGGYIITLCKKPSLLTDDTQTVLLLAVPIIILFVMAKLKKI